MKCTNPRTKVIVVEPGRRFVESFEEIAQHPGRFAQSLFLLLNSGLDETVQIRWRQRGEFLHYRVQLGIADSRMPYIVVCRRPIVAKSLGITFGIR